VRLAEAVGRRSPGRRTAAEASPRQHDRHVDRRAVQLCFVHVRNCALGIRRRGIQHVGNSAVRQELAVDRHFQVLNVAVGTKDFAQVCFVDVFCEFFDHDLCAARLAVGARWACGSRA
jgi:hypothetical protein